MKMNPDGPVNAGGFALALHVLDQDPDADRDEQNGDEIHDVRLPGFTQG